MAPSSPKEKRRSTRRSANSSSKSSGSSGSPSPDTAPTPAPPSLSEAARSVASSSSGAASRGKRSKDDGEEFHAPPPPSHRRTNSHASAVNGASNAPAPSSSKRTKRKGKDAVSVDDIVDATSVGAVDAKKPEPTEDPDNAEEDGGITRCVCNGLALDDDGDAPDFMIQCEQCLAWQHGPCMGFAQESEIPEGNYYCEQCKPEDHVELLKKLARRQRHSSEKSVQKSRTSRSHSPTYFLKPPKRRNTMNSRDAAYEENIQELLDATAAEAVPNTDSSGKDGAESVAKTEEPIEEIIEIGPGGRKKRKRADDDGQPTKRKRSTSLISEGLGATTTAQDKPEVTTPITTALLPPPAPTGKSRARRGGGRKNAAAQEALALANGDSEDAPTATTKKHPNQYTYRSKSTNNQSRRAPQSSSGQTQNPIGHDHGTRRNTNNAANSGGSSSGSRNSHNAYYNNVQLPMFASWGLPDYLNHLQSILPSEVPPPLQIRGSTSFIREDFGDANAGSTEALTAAAGVRGSVGSSTAEPAEAQTPQMAEVLANATEAVTERGVKVKWPAKRTSVADMNKRVRALVEWVGREQALALDRERRKVALEKALRAHLGTLRRDSHSSATTEEATDGTSEALPAMLLDGTTPARSPQQETNTMSGHVQTGPAKNPGNSLLCTNSTRPSTTKMMEELMEELISFQERFGPSAKGQTRDRRVAVIS